MRKSSIQRNVTSSKNFFILHKTVIKYYKKAIFNIKREILQFQKWINTIL